jgi:hypothetical protein
LRRDAARSTRVSISPAVDRSEQFASLLRPSLSKLVQGQLALRDKMNDACFIVRDKNRLALAYVGRSKFEKFLRKVAEDEDEDVESK